VFSSTLVALVALPPLTGCIVKERCFAADDCPAGLTCDLATGACGPIPPECVVALDCGEVGFACEDGTCVAHCEDVALTCPSDQVPVCGAFCMDAWEASRPDATDQDAGIDGSVATSRAGVLPWFSTDPDLGMNRAIAAAACEAGGKRLCTAAEWKLSCAGTAGLSYSYGDAYDPVACNGIDTYCACDGQDPYAYCYYDCAADYRVMPTGSFPMCVSAWGAWDLNGNVWESVDADDALEHFRGGAYNCGDSQQNHRCDYDATWDPTAKGFRCCSDGSRP